MLSLLVKTFTNTLNIMSKIFTISAASLISKTQDLTTDLLYLGYFFFNSFYDTLVIVDVERFGNSEQIQVVFNELIKPGRHYCRGPYEYELGVREKDKEKLDVIHGLVKPNHQLTIVIRKIGQSQLGVYKHIAADVRYMPKNVSTPFPSKDYEVYNEDLDDDFKMKNRLSYIVIYGRYHDNRDLKTLANEFENCFLPTVFTMGGEDGNLEEARLDEYFAYLCSMGSKLKNGVVRFSPTRKINPSPLFMELTAEAIKSGLSESGVVQPVKLEIPSNGVAIMRFGVKFGYDDIGFPEEITLAVQEAFCTDSETEEGTTHIEKSFYLVSQD